MSELRMKSLPSLIYCLILENKMKLQEKYFRLVVVLLVCTTQLQAADYGTFESFYNAGGLGFWEWTAIIAGTVGFAALTFFTFGGTGPAIPGWMATVGTWIGAAAGLSGVAATNFGLALLGGGAVAAGGLGIAGGVAMLTAVSSFGVDITLSYGVDVALERWNYAKFIEANREMLTLPMPRNPKGGEAYQAAMDYLRKNFKQDMQISAPENQGVLQKASEILQNKIQDEEDQNYILKDKTLLAMLYLQMNRYSEASSVAGQAMGLADKIAEKKSLPSFIWALSEIADPDKVCTDDVIQAFRAAYYLEADNKLIPIMTGGCMDRFMYRYHYGHLPIKYLSYFCEIITAPLIGEELAAASLEIFVTRCLIELKRTKQDIYIVTKDPDMMDDAEVVIELSRRFDRHKALIVLLQNEVLPQVGKLMGHFPKESRITPLSLTKLLNSYYDDLADLKQQIKYVPVQ